MFLVSQDKKTIVNTNKIHGYMAVSKEIRAFDGSEDYFVLGEYPTEQRAGEVLIDVCNKFKAPIAIMYGVVEMPEE